jgi:ankyrin repeat protein
MQATYSVTNVYGANVLHIAAQGNEPAPIVYFVSEKHLDVNSTDNKGNTALHWCCHSKTETALAYILALDPDI